ncbi:PAS domain-containing protein, partial [Klebsiella pneumoniae]|nr:PAS domain-containing protein [Klebsiella pneumoniae]
MDHPVREPAGSTAWGPMRREVFDRSRIAVIQRDLSNHVIYANAAALAMCGVKDVQDLHLDQVFAGEAGRVLAEETRHRRQGELGAYRV